MNINKVKAISGHKKNLRYQNTGYESRNLLKTQDNQLSYLNHHRVLMTEIQTGVLGDKLGVIKLGHIWKVSENNRNWW